jgi:hypothetical protein
MRSFLLHPGSPWKNPHLQAAGRRHEFDKPSSPGYREAAAKPKKTSAETIGVRGAKASEFGIFSAFEIRIRISFLFLLSFWPFMHKVSGIHERY